MNYIKLLVSILLLSSPAGAAESPFYWQGQFAKALPSGGLYLDNQKALRLGTDDSTHYVELKATNAMPSNTTIQFPLANPGIGQVLYSTDNFGTLDWEDPGASLTTVKAYIAQIPSKQTVDLVCASNITLSGIQTCDGVSTTASARIVAIAQTDQTENGIWINNDFGAWQRPFEMTSIQSVPGSLISVTESAGGLLYSEALLIGIGDGSSTAGFDVIPTAVSSAPLTASKVVVTVPSGYLDTATTTTAEINYVSGVTSAIQTQLNAKQASDATLTALAAYNTNGLLTQTSADTFTGRTLTGTTNRLTVTNGDGVAGNPTADISSSYVGQSTITTLGTISTGTWSGTTIAVNKGGTGITSFGTGVATWLGTPSSANLASATTDETGSGALCFATAPSFTTNIDLLAAAESRYYNAGGTFYVGFKGGNAAANKIWTLPLADGSANQVLSTNGSGTLSWASSATNPTTTTGDIIYSSTTATPGTLARLGIGASTTVLHGGTTPSYSQVAISTDVSGLGTNVATWLGTPSSANLASALTDETGTGAAVFGTSPTIATPSLTGNNGASTVAAGNIGEVLSQMGNSTTCNTSTFVTVASITLTAGTWMISAGAEQSDAGTTAIELQYRYNSTNNTTLGDGYWIWPGDATAGSSGTIPTRFQQVVSGDASKVAAIQLRASVANNKTCVGAITAIRVQ